MLEAEDLVPSFPDHFGARAPTPAPAPAVSATTPDPAATPDSAEAAPVTAEVPAGTASAVPEAQAATPKASAVVAPAALEAAPAVGAAAAPAAPEGSELSSLIAPRSFASLQLRAKNATKALFAQKREHLLVLCSSTSVDGIATAVDLVREVKGLEPTVAYAPTKFEFFGNDKEDGLITAAGTNGLNVVVMPCVHLIDHPKWLGMLDACLAQNEALKLILVGDATDVAQLSILWPTLENALQAEIVLDFSSVGALETIAGLISYYQTQVNPKPERSETTSAEINAVDAAGNMAGAAGNTAGAADNTAGAADKAAAAEGEYLRAFSREAVALLAGYCCRLSGDRRYLGLTELSLKSVIFEANRYAAAAGCSFVKQRHVLKALGAVDFRHNFLAEASLREHRDRQLLIATKGAIVGQINGLSVIETLGTSYEYGEPVRITATLRAGGEGDVIDIERKAELAGQIHAKAMMIINGFLTKEFGAESPLPVSASLVFEQSYSEIDGDSASLTGLCAVISVLANAPVSQALAVTGAVDQLGDVQAVGGVNEKIEGFYRVCRLHGFTGTQGVIIPRACVNQLVLRPAVVKAVAEGKFFIFTVDHVTEAVKLLTTLDWGDGATENTICARINERLNNIVASNQELTWYQALWERLKGLVGSGDSEHQAPSHHAGHK